MMVLSNQIFVLFSFLFFFFCNPHSMGGLVGVDWTDLSTRLIFLLFPYV